MNGVSAIQLLALAEIEASLYSSEHHASPGYVAKLSPNKNQTTTA